MTATQPILDEHYRAAGQKPIPHVVAWNLTKRCNLACAHCYISAGPWQATDTDLSADEFRRIADEIFQLNPSPMFILTGGEPLVRTDLEELASYASGRGATVVVGTNGTGLTTERIRSLGAAGVTGVAISIDSLDEHYHNRFRHGETALSDTMAAVDRLKDEGMDFIIQTSLTNGNRHELRDLVAWSADKGAVSFNLYFLVQTGRGAGMSGLETRDNDDVLKELVQLQKEYRGRMLVRSKCQPQLMRHVYDQDPDSPLLNYSTRCPCGIQYCRITPDGKLTACPYVPTPAGDLREQTFEHVWNESALLKDIRAGELGGKCGRCEYREICGGCRARALAESDALMGADESCYYEPTGELELIKPTRDVTYGMGHKQILAWTPEADARMARIPSFVRGVVMKRVEEYARKNGYSEISIALLDEVRSNMPIDFSKRRPFFMRSKKD